MRKATLTKIIKADRPRILIADEVGVGKTIETGIIIKEFEKRENIRNILIVCPKELTYKWRREMRERFDEPFEILSSDRLEHCFRELELEGVWPFECRKSIIGLEMLRREENLNRFIKLEDAPNFNMLIVDEAHHIINPNSKSHQVIEYLCEHTESVVFLSATPLQLSSYDLFSLLNLLDPSEFIDDKVFKQMVQPNGNINCAIRCIRNTTNPNWQTEAVEALKNVCVNEWARNVFSGNAKLNYWIEKLSDNNKLTDDERIDCLKDLENLHTLSHIINRTKRKDIGEFTIREPITVNTVFNPEEQEFYNQVKAFKYTILDMKYGKIIANLVMSTIERQLTSCIPAFVDLLEGFLQRGIFSLNDVTDDIDIEDENISLKGIADFEDWAEKIKDASKILPQTDAKTVHLLNIFNDTKRNTDAGKLLVFSFFKHTLRYLYKQISSAGIRVAVITGETDGDERETLRNRFRLDKNDENALDVLLCSEVGCEGLDYEFCSRMVNYDIPWNPMKIEQRIGRIDRFGQKSEKVQIYNFITNGTVEEKVFFRCFERLGIFNSTLGDLEEVLGDIVAELTITAFDTKLSEQQSAQKANQIADNVLRLANEKREFEKNSKDLFLLDLKSEDESINTDKQIQVKTTKNVISAYLRECYPTATVTENDKTNGLKIRMFKDDKSKMLTEVLALKKSRKIEKNSKTVATFEKYLASDNQMLNLVFEHSDTADYTDCILASIDHPLLKLATGYFNNRNILQTSFRVKFDNLSKGRYIFGSFEWCEIGYKESKEIKTVIYNCDNHHTDIINTSLLDSLILMGDDCDCFDFAIDDEIAKLDSQILAEQSDKKLRQIAINTDIVTRKSSTLDRYYAGIIEKIQYDIDNNTSKAVRIMKEAELSNKKAIWAQKKQELLQKATADITVKLIAKGYMESCK